MKYLSLCLFFCFLISLNINCTSKHSESIKIADELVSQRKYLSAYQYLDKIDPKKEDVDILLKKIEIAQNYFVQSINHKRFALTDLQKEDDLLNLRKGTGAFILLPELNIPKILDSLKLKNPSNYNVNLALASYYGDYWNRFGYEREIQDSILKLINNNNQIAYDNGAFSFRQCYELGVNAISKDSQYTRGISLLQKSIDLNQVEDNYFLFNHTFYLSEANYNIGFCYYKQELYDSAQKYFYICLDYCKDSSYISSICTKLGRISESKKNKNKAIELYKKALLFDSTKLENYINILKVNEGQIGYDSLLSTFFNNNKNDCNFLAALNYYYYNKKESLELIDFYSKYLRSEKTDFATTANLNYYISQLYFGLNDLISAKKYLILSKEFYLKYLTSDAEIIAKINDALVRYFQN